MQPDTQVSWGLEEYDGLGDEAPSGPSVPDGAVAGVIVVQPDGSPCVGWLMAHPSVANVSGAKRRALVQLSVLHAHDLELQTCIATDDERIVAATRRGDALHGCTALAPAESAGAVASGSHTSNCSHGAVEQQRELPEGNGSLYDAAYDPPGRDWLEEMRARDAALQARIAKGDAAIFGVS